MSAHTPGPLFVHRTHAAQCYVTTTRKFDPDEPAIATVWGPRDVAYANARLIAAAPELLDACRAVIGQGYTDARHPAGQDFVHKHAIEKVRAAIAKAEGA